MKGMRELVAEAKDNWRNATNTHRHLDLHRLASLLLRLGSGLGGSLLHVLSLHAAHSLRLSGHSHNHEDDNRNDNNRNHTQNNNHHNRHAITAGLLPHAVLLSQHARSLLRTDVVALHRALVHRHLAYVGSLEHALGHAATLAHRDGDRHERRALRVLAVHRVGRLRHGLARAADFTRLRVQGKALRERGGVRHEEAGDEVGVGGHARRRRHVDHKGDNRRLVLHVAGHLVGALVRLHVAQHVVVALSVRVAAEAVGTLRRRDLTLAHHRILVDGGTGTRAGGSAVQQEVRAERHGRGGGVVDLEAQLAEAGDAHGHAPGVAVQRLRGLLEQLQRGGVLVFLGLARVQREAPGGARVHGLPGVGVEARALQVLHRPLHVGADGVGQVAEGHGRQVEEFSYRARGRLGAVDGREGVLTGLKDFRFRQV